MSIRLSDEYEEAFGRMLAELDQKPDVACEPMSACWPIIGHEYQGDLLVISQAPNGWEGKLDVHQLKYPEYRNRVVKKARAVAESGICNLATRCPMLWVTDQWKGTRQAPSTGKSSFWRVVRLVVDRLNLGDAERDNWPSALAWSNLYKVSPKEGGNPAKNLKAAQEPAAIALIKRELAELAPRRVLALTGLDWFTPFAEALGLNLVKETGPVIDAYAFDGDTHWLVARHPSRLPKDLTESAFADMVAHAFWRQSA